MLISFEELNASNVDITPIVDDLTTKCSYSNLLSYFIMQPVALNVLKGGGIIEYYPYKRVEFTATTSCDLSDIVENLERCDLWTIEGILKKELSKRGGLLDVYKVGMMLKGLKCEVKSNRVELTIEMQVCFPYVWSILESTGGDGSMYYSNFLTSLSSAIKQLHSSFSVIDLILNEAYHINEVSNPYRTFYDAMLHSLKQGGYIVNGSKELIIRGKEHYKIAIKIR